MGGLVVANWPEEKLLQIFACNACGPPGNQSMGLKLPALAPRALGRRTVERDVRHWVIGGRRRQRDLVGRHAAGQEI
jgi:hypothetical protein